MTEIITLEAQPRTITGKKVKQLRAMDWIPAVIYGQKLEQAVNIQVPVDNLRAALRRAGGTGLIEITVGADKHTVLVREVQRDVLSNDILHVDFHAVSLDTQIRTEVPFVTVGTPEMVRTGEAIVATESILIEIEALPTNIPAHLELNVARLAEIGDFLTVADLDVPEGVTVLTEPTEVLVRLEYATRPEEEELEGPVEAAGEVEVIRRGKEEEEEE